MGVERQEGWVGSRETGGLGLEYRDRRVELRVQRQEGWEGSRERGGLG